MLSQTKEQIKLILDKVQLLDFVLNSLNLSHKDEIAKVEELCKKASTHKMKLLEEILVLSNAIKD